MTDFLMGTPYPLKSLKGMVDIKYGKGLPEKERDTDGKKPVYGSNGIVGYHSQTITQSPVIIIGRKGSVGAVNFSQSECWPIDTSFYIDVFPEDVNPKWMFYSLRAVDFRVHAQGPKPGIRRDLLYQLRIPVPTPDEQRRIVSRIEELTSRAEEVHRLSFEIEDNLDLFLKAAYYRMIEGVQWKPLKEVASFVRRVIHIKPDEEYEEMGVRSFGKGTFRKPILTGRQIGSKRIYRIHEGDLVFNNVFAWEGAIAVAQSEDYGRVGSHRFITYVPHQGKATSESLCYHFLSEKGLEDICAASPGSAGRNRTLGLEKLKNINVPVPNYQKQLLFSRIAKRRREVQRESATIRQKLVTYETAVIAKAFRGEL
jgi:type I restriction enzyme S subunit